MLEKPERSAGFTLIEVLVTLLVFSVGILGFATLQSRAQKAELEVYQRVHAINLIEHIVNQIRNNPEARRCYGISTTGSGTGLSAVYIPDIANPTNANPGGTYSCSSWGPTEAVTQANEDILEWRGLLMGATETAGGGNVGGLANARGCIDYAPAAPPVSESYTITVVWQGLVDTVDPSVSGITCAAGIFAADPAKRRAVTYNVRVADLSG